LVYSLAIPFRKEHLKLWLPSSKLNLFLLPRRSFYSPFVYLKGTKANQKKAGSLNYFFAGKLIFQLSFAQG